MAVTNTQKDQIILLKEKENLSVSAIARKMKLSRPTVTKVLKSDYSLSTQLIDSIKQIEHDKNIQLLDLIRNDDRTNSIVSKILTKFDSDEEIAATGLKTLATVFGVLVDKIIKVEELKLKQKTFDFAKEIKETYKPENDNFKNAAAEALIKLARTGNMMDFIEADSLLEDDNVS